MKLTPTENLALEVLIARYRTGEHLWTFDSKPAIVKALDSLNEKKLVWTMHGSVEHTVRAGLTAHGVSKYVGNYTPPNGIQDPVALVQGMIAFREDKLAWVNDQRRENSTAIFGHGGASVKPYWTNKTEEAAMLAYLQGERMPEFDGTLRDKTKEVALEIGYDVAGQHWWLGIQDPALPAYGGADAWGVWFEPDGTFYAAHSNRVHIRAFQAEVPREESFNAFLETLRESRKMDLEDPSYQNRVKSERRSRGAKD